MNTAPDRTPSPCGCTVFRQCPFHWAEKMERWQKTQQRIQEMRTKHREHEVNALLNRDGLAEEGEAS